MAADEEKTLTKTAAERVLTTPELLDEILLDLPQQQLLLVQRVCRTWRHCITSSNPLQAALFLRPGTTCNAKSQDPKRAPSAVEFNPLLQSRFPSFFDGSVYINDLNLHLHNLGPWKSTDWFQGKSRHPLSRPSAQDKQRMAAYARAEASWRRMVPCWPALEELQVCFGRQGADGSLRSLKFPSKGGDEGAVRPSWLTFGELYDVVEEAWFRGRRSMRVVVDHITFDYASENMFLKFMRAPVQEALPGTRVGGAGRVLVHMNERPPKRSFHGSYGRASLSEMRLYVDEFRSAGALRREIRWDEETAFRFPA